MRITLRAAALALGVAALTVPAFAQTNTHSGTQNADSIDIQQGKTGSGPNAGTEGGTKIQGSSGMMAPRTRSTTGTGQKEDSSGSQIDKSQLGMKPGGMSGAPANPCTTALKAQSRC